MLNDQLAAPLEKIRECFLAIRAIEEVFLLDLDPWQLAALPVHLIALASQCLLLDEQFFAGRFPFRWRYQLPTFYGARFHDEIPPLLRVSGIFSG
jgi:hypothetical protein